MLRYYVIQLAHFINSNGDPILGNSPLPFPTSQIHVNNYPIKNSEFMKSVNVYNIEKNCR